MASAAALVKMTAICMLVLFIGRPMVHASSRLQVAGGGGETISTADSWGLLDENDDEVCGVACHLCLQYCESICPRELSCCLSCAQMYRCRTLDRLQAQH